MVDRAAMQKAHEIFDPIVAEHLARPGVDIGRMFSTEGLRIRGKIYAFVEHEGGLVVKVPRSRAEELARTGAANRMIMREREMREWVVVPFAAGADQWRLLVDEARDFVDSITPR